LIIACTANALKGEAENCFAAGMNDYISKPVELGTLMLKLDKWLPLPGGGVGADPPIDRGALAEISGGDADLEQMIFTQFSRANVEDVALAARAFESRDFSLMARAAHRMKGAATSIGAKALAAVCARLESASLAADWNAVAVEEEAFHREVGRLDAHLEVLREIGAATRDSGTE
jgi:HPt (histidine-containing phosphotransfer) domain-containing protein